MGAAATLFGPGSKPDQAGECERAHASLEMPLLVFSPGPGGGRQLGGPEGRDRAMGSKGTGPDKAWFLKPRAPWGSGFR